MKSSPQRLMDIDHIISAIAVKREIQPPTEMDSKTLFYLAAAMIVGSISSVAALLADESREMTMRIVVAYVFLGACASLGVVALLLEKYGDSYFLIGVAVFASYKAVDILAAISFAVTGLLKRFVGGHGK